MQQIELKGLGSGLSFDLDVIQKPIKDIQNQVKQAQKTAKTAAIVVGVWGLLVLGLSGFNVYLSLRKK